MIHDHRLKLVEIKRLDEVVIEPRGFRMRAILVGAVTADRDQHRVA